MLITISLELRKKGIICSDFIAVVLIFFFLFFLFLIAENVYYSA